jgi:acyl homoserine lactone synthase
MLEIVQAGQAGKTKLLFDMHRMRKRVFKDRMGWDVQVTEGGLEVDQFDIEDTVYLLALNDDRQVIGNWRLLPTTGPTMIRDVWPQFLDTMAMPSSPDVWETSRFAVDSPAINPEEGLAQVNRATRELFVGLTELCLLCGIKQIFTFYDMRIARLLKRIDCPPTAISARLKVDDFQAEVGCFTTDEAMLARLRQAAGVTETLVTLDMLPPVLQHYRARLKQLPRTQTDTVAGEDWNDIAVVPALHQTPSHVGR